MSLADSSAALAACKLVMLRNEGNKIARYRDTMMACSSETAISPPSSPSCSCGDKPGTAQPSINSIEESIDRRELSKPVRCVICDTYFQQKTPKTLPTSHWKIDGDATPFFKTPAIVLLDRARRAILPFILAVVPDLTLIIDFQQSPRVIANL